CMNEGEHWHEYPANTSYVYSGSYYTYSGPTEVYYYDYHPVPNGGYCYIHGRHSHAYLPGTYANNYYWDNGRNVYVYGGPDYHAATAVNAPPYAGNNSYPRPPPGQGSNNGYVAPGGNGYGYVTPPGAGSGGNGYVSPPGGNGSGGNGYVSPPGGMGSAGNNGY